MKNKLKKLGLLLFLIIITFNILGCNNNSESKENIYKLQKFAEKEIDNNKRNKNHKKENNKNIIKEGKYTSKEDVAKYIEKYKTLPSNYIKKNEAKNKGWNAEKGNLDKILKGKSIGGDRFGNFEKKLPDKKGRKWFEADIDYKGGHRNSKRIVYSNDGYIYYTEDHYNNFELMRKGED